MLLSLSSLKTFFMGSRRNAPMIMPSSSHSSSSWGFLMRYCCLWSLRILKEIKVSLITFEVMPDMVNTLSVVCRFEFVYGHHQLELNRPSWKMSSGFVDICGYVFALMFAFFWFNLNWDRNLLHKLLIYRHSLISAVSISAIFDLTRFIILSYFPPL